MQLSRRGVLGLLGAAALDPERLLWLPGKLISIPKPKLFDLEKELRLALAEVGEALRRHGLILREELAKRNTRTPFLRMTLTAHEDYQGLAISADL